MDETHNHETSELLFSHLPKQRRLAPQVKSEVIELMDMKTNKKLVQEKVQSETGHIVTHKDLDNTYSSGTQFEMFRVKKQ